MVRDLREARASPWPLSWISFWCVNASGGLRLYWWKASWSTGSWGVWWSSWEKCSSQGSASLPLAAGGPWWQRRQWLRGLCIWTRL